MLSTLSFIISFAREFHTGILSVKVLVKSCNFWLVEEHMQEKVRSKQSNTKQCLSLNLNFLYVWNMESNC